MVRLLIPFLLVSSAAAASYVLQPGEVGVTTTTVSIDYSADTQFTYTSTEVEFTSGSAKLKNQFASNVMSAATFTSLDDLTYSRDGGTLTGTATGTVSITSGQLDLSGDSGAFKKVAYKPYKNLPGFGIGAVKFKVTPAYSGAPATKQSFFTTSRTASSSNNFITVAHITNGDLYLEVTDYLVVVLLSAGAAWNPTAGVQYEFEANFNAVTGGHRLFIDGVQHVATAGGTGTFNHMYDYWHIGADVASTATDYAHFKIDDLVIYDAVQHTSGYTPGYSVPETKYLTTDPAIITTDAITVEAFESLEIAVTASGSDSVKCQPQIDGTNKYWNGSAWANSNGLIAQANTPADIATNIDTLSGGSFKLRCLLHSNDGSTTPTISSAVLVYQ